MEETRNCKNNQYNGFPVYHLDGEGREHGFVSSNYVDILKLTHCTIDILDVVGTKTILITGCWIKQINANPGCKFIIKGATTIGRIRRGKDIRVSMSDDSVIREILTDAPHRYISYVECYSKNFNNNNIAKIIVGMAFGKECDVVYATELYTYKNGMCTLRMVMRWNHGKPKKPIIHKYGDYMEARAKAKLSAKKIKKMIDKVRNGYFHKVDRYRMSRCGPRQMSAMSLCEYPEKLKDMCRKLHISKNGTIYEIRDRVLARLYAMFADA